MLEGDKACLTWSLPELHELRINTWGTVELGCSVWIKPSCVWGDTQLWDFLPNCVAQCLGEASIFMYDNFSYPFHGVVSWIALFIFSTWYSEMIDKWKDAHLVHSWVGGESGASCSNMFLISLSSPLKICLWLGYLILSFLILILYSWIYSLLLLKCQL